MGPGEVSGLKNGEPVTAGVPVLGGDYKDRMADRLLGLTGKCSDFELYSVVDRKPVEVTKSLTG